MFVRKALASQAKGLGLNVNAIIWLLLIKVILCEIYKILDLVSTIYAVYRMIVEFSTSFVT